MINELILDSPLLRADNSMSAFLQALRGNIQWILNNWIPKVITAISNEPILMFGFGVFALVTTISVFGRLLSRD